VTENFLGHRGHWCRSVVHKKRSRRLSEGGGRLRLSTSHLLAERRNFGLAAIAISAYSSSKLRAEARRKRILDGRSDTEPIAAYKG
jgi:hypothetical protein